MRNIKLLDCILLLALFGHAARANPIPEALNSSTPTQNADNEELNDMNEPLQIKTLENSNAQTISGHHDDTDKSDSSDGELDENLKYEVEILESQNTKTETETVELEERFRGPGALKMGTDTFVAENIEVSAFENDDVKASALMAAHETQRITLTIILVLSALVSIALYVALVIWRSHLEQRYGMRELLVTNDDDFYVNNNNNRSDDNISKN